MKKEKIPNFYYVYLITNLILNKQYVGSKLCYKDDPLNDNYWGSSKYLSADIEIYGKENFTKEIITAEYTNKNDMLNGETEYILKYDTLEPNGYNRFLPNQRRGFHTAGCKHTDETIEKMRGPKSEEHKQKLKGPKSEEHKQHMKDNHADVSGKNNPMFGKSVYDTWVEKFGKEEADRKMKESYKPLPEERKQKIQNSLIGKYTGEKNGMYGTSTKEKWIIKYGEEEGLKKWKELNIKRGESCKGKTKGRKKTEIEIQNIKNGLQKREKLTCPICGKIMDPCNFKKYKHGDNCKGYIK